MNSHHSLSWPEIQNYFGCIRTNNEDYFPLYSFLIWVRVLCIFGGLVKFQNVDMGENYVIKLSTSQDEYSVKGKMSYLFFLEDVRFF